jgi:hypothetical protein
MSLLERSGGESAVPTRSQAALDNWQNFQTNRRCSPRRGYCSSRYRDIANNRDFTIPPPISPLSEYVDYNKDFLLFGHAPEPIEEDKTWRLVGGNTKGIKPYGGSADLISVMERLKLLQTGTVAFQETNLEWHIKGYRDEFQKLLAKAFGAARVEHSTTKDNFETTPFKPGGTASAALKKIVHRVVKTSRDDTGCGRWSYITFNGKENIHRFQQKHFDSPATVNNLRYDSQKCWKALAKLFLDEAASRSLSNDNDLIPRYLTTRAGIG